MAKAFEGYLSDAGKAFPTLKGAVEHDVLTVIEKSFPEMRTIARNEHRFHTLIETLRPLYEILVAEGLFKEQTTLEPETTPKTTLTADEKFARFRPSSEPRIIACGGLGRAQEQLEDTDNGKDYG